MFTLDHDRFDHRTFREPGTEGHDRFAPVQASVRIFCMLSILAWGLIFTPTGASAAKFPINTRNDAAIASSRFEAGGYMVGITPGADTRPPKTQDHPDPSETPIRLSPSDKPNPVTEADHVGKQPDIVADGADANRDTQLPPKGAVTDRLPFTAAPSTGRVQFGDGVTGKVPPGNAGGSESVMRRGVPLKSSDTCRTGFVWRDARPNDHVCVTPETRSRVAEENSGAAARRDPKGAYGPNSCKTGFVWREAFAGDVVCVTPDIREATKVENRLGLSRRAVR